MEAVRPSRGPGEDATGPPAEARTCERAVGRLPRPAGLFARVVWSEPVRPFFGSWRRLRIYHQSPGCRQGTILAPVTAWRRLPGSSGTWPLYILVCSAVTSERANDTCARTSGSFRRRRRGTARRITVITAVTAGHGGHGRPRPKVSDAQHSRTILSHDPYG